MTGKYSYVSTKYYYETNKRKNKKLQENFDIESATLDALKYLIHQVKEETYGIKVTTSKLIVNRCKSKCVTDERTLYNQLIDLQ